LSICIIFNPAARSEGAQRFLRAIKVLSPHWVLKPTSAPGDARRLAAEAAVEGHETIVAAGGDGTLNEVLNGMVDAPDGLARARLGVLPVGTINVFAREIGMPRKLSEILEVLESGAETRIDLGRAEYVREGRPEVRHFVQLAGAGFDARVIAMVSWEAKRRFGVLAYLHAALKLLSAPGPVVTIDNGAERRSGDLVRIGNGRFYGGSLPFLHKSDLKDGVLDAAIFPCMNWRTLPGHLLSIGTRRMFAEGGSIYLRGHEFELTSPGPAGLQLDGELVGELPAKLKVLPRVLRVVWPKPL
jgi:YegS/Rv2252/BmrU family lipid kinase